MCIFPEAARAREESRHSNRRTRTTRSRCCNPTLAVWDFWRGLAAGRRSWGERTRTARSRCCKPGSHKTVDHKTAGSARVRAIRLGAPDRGGAQVQRVPECAENGLPDPTAAKAFVRSPPTCACACFCLCAPRGGGRKWTRTEMDADRPRTEVKDADVGRTRATPFPPQGLMPQDSAPVFPCVCGCFGEMARRQSVTEHRSLFYE
eukprot:gene25268-biopygen4492